MPCHTKTWHDGTTQGMIRDMTSWYNTNTKTRRKGRIQTPNTRHDLQYSRRDAQAGHEARRKDRTGYKNRKRHDDAKTRRHDTRRNTHHKRSMTRCKTTRHRTKTQYTDTRQMHTGRKTGAKVQKEDITSRHKARPLDSTRLVSPAPRVLTRQALQGLVAYEGRNP